MVLLPYKYKSEEIKDFGERKIIVLGTGESRTSKTNIIQIRKNQSIHN